jgi:hypothetical protein
MASSRRTNWALIAGLVRNEAAFMQQLQGLVALRSEGYISGIVYSTWIGELDKYPVIAQFISGHDIGVVELAQPTLKLPGHILHQMVTLHYGLQLIPDDAYVLRMRPDLQNLPGALRDFLDKEYSLELGELDGWPAVFRERVLIHSCNLITPFYINDMIFYGAKRDVQRLISFDVTAEVIFSEMAPEQFYFSPPFTSAIPIFRSFFSVNTAYVFDNRNWARHYIEKHLASEFFLKVWLTYLLCLNKYFRINFDQNSRRREALDYGLMKNVSLGELLSQQKTLPHVLFHPSTHLPILHSETCVAGILSGAFRSDAYAERVLQLLPEVRRWSFQGGWRVNPLLVDPEVRRFSQEVTEPLGTAKVRIDRINDGKSKRFLILSTGERWEVLGGGDVIQALEAELSRMRRASDELHEVVANQEAELRGLRNNDLSRGS